MSYTLQYPKELPNGDEEIFEVTLEVSSYRPATQFEPEEHAEIMILGITNSDKVVVTEEALGISEKELKEWCWEYASTATAYGDDEEPDEDHLKEEMRERSAEWAKEEYEDDPED